MLLAFQSIHRSPQPMHLKARPIRIKQDLRGHCLTMPWRRSLADEEDVNFFLCRALGVQYHTNDSNFAMQERPPQVSHIASTESSVIAAA